jgi:hypothetical protein
MQVIACLAALGSKFCESYQEWLAVMFAVRNESNSTEAVEAFVEWR